MAVGFSSYDIARSGLMVSERGLAVTGHNLSNVNTTGYVRQQLMIESSPYINEYGKNGRLFQYGLGADIQETRQIRHTFLDNIYRRENTSLGYWETRGKAFGDVESILNDPMADGGLQEVMNQFWDSWQELTKNPESLTTRALVRQRGQALVYHFNHIGQQLDKLQNDLNSEIQVRIGELNNITSQIATLNYKIASQEINSDSANDFRDQRNLLLDRLSKLCNAEALEMQDGQVDITLGGYYLVQKGTSRNLYVEANAKNGNYFYPMLEGTNIEVNIKSGILKGLMEARGEVPGIKGTYENGNPREKVDITIGIDTTQGPESSYLADLKAYIGKFVSDLKITGTDFNIRFVNMDSVSQFYGGPDNVYTQENIDALLSDPGFDALFDGSAGTDADFGTFADEIQNSINNYRADATKVAYIFTNKSIDGSLVDTSGDAGHIQKLIDCGVKTSIITNKSFMNQGQDATEIGWSKVAAATGGEVFALGSTEEEYTSVFAGMNMNMRQAVNAAMGNILPSNNIVSDVKIKLNAMVNAIAREINYLQKSGFTLDGKPGVDFFAAIDDRYPMQMGNLRLSDELLSDKGLNNITASSSTAKGDNSIARKIANLRDADLMEDSAGDVTIDEFYRSVILDIGNGGAEANRITESQTTLVQSADEQRTAISGVSMDEEMANMMKFKFAYDASSRVLNIIDSMLENVIMAMGKVGR
ncbi:flagellar hook-associated protein 1 [Ruminiclostridium hungatei]|uniref:Flagellar hook-associated protein 1 n=1 Tax=Ruminiclostridium hungatei TaxID=48256 RepID=A0A1V4SPF2_RUMHU|nr:flagellar hook-associated protein FlgK [Ruminiclostridium hungatei]OPX45673.1 flagellar hook-associated protein 1 [Ruminiclostridium hungatei]